MLSNRRRVRPTRVREDDIAFDQFREIHQEVDTGALRLHQLQVFRGSEHLRIRPAIENVRVGDLCQ